MRHLNYTHLLYFWTVAREGTIAKAAEVLHLTPQTISGQLKLLEEAVDEPLFSRVGRGLVLTETGQVVNQYADEIFQLGAELTQRVKSKQALVPTIFNVGIVNSIPKLVALRILEPALGLDDSVRINCREGDMDLLLGDLAVHNLDLVISDRPLNPGTSVKAYNHKLGESGISFFAHRSIAKNFSNFPEQLNHAPMLLPNQTSPIRHHLEDWFDRQSLVPEVIAEFDDSALLKAFGEAGLGVYPAPTAISEQVCSMYHSKQLGTLGDQVTESYFAISPERKLKHPAVLAITESAQQLFQNR
ncbi:MAG: transcriptional activator NhaR [Pseudomonadota bacterium]